jgi:hypothetical protein
VLEPCLEDSPDWLSDGVNPSHADSAEGRWKRCQSPPSSRWIDSAVSVSMPRNALSLATVGHHAGSVASCDSCSAIAVLRDVIPSTAASRSAKTALLAASSNRC